MRSLPFPVAVIAADAVAKMLAKSKDDAAGIGNSG